LDGRRKLVRSRQIWLSAFCAPVLSRLSTAPQNARSGLPRLLGLCGFVNRRGNVRKGRWRVEKAKQAGLLRYASERRKIKHPHFSAP
jgi:hypothetical protein